MSTIVDDHAERRVKIVIDLLKSKKKEFTFNKTNPSYQEMRFINALDEFFEF